MRVLRATDGSKYASAPAEDLPEASFAGQQQTFLNVNGERRLLEACRRCFASLFTDRAIVYRESHGFDHLRVALSVVFEHPHRRGTSDPGCNGWCGRIAAPRA